MWWPVWCHHRRGWVWIGRRRRCAWYGSTGAAALSRCGLVVAARCRWVWIGRCGCRFVAGLLMLPGVAVAPCQMCAAGSWLGCGGRWLVVINGRGLVVVAVIGAVLCLARCGNFHRCRRSDCLPAVAVVMWWPWSVRGLVAGGVAGCCISVMWSPVVWLSSARLVRGRCHLRGSLRCFWFFANNANGRIFSKCNF